MPEVSEHRFGSPCWVDLGSPDIGASVTFYSGLFGWDCVDLGEEAGHYTMCQLRGKPVAAFGQAMNPGPPYWATYFAVSDCDAAVGRIADAGGTVVLPGMDVMTAGRMAVGQDPTGGYFSIWQPGEHLGAGIVREASTFAWAELNVRDVGRAVDFYQQVFGWAVRVDGDPVTYREFLLDGESVAGCMEMGDSFPPELPTNWLVYFSSDDVDADLARAVELGATVLMATFDTPAGPMAVVADPQGAVFALIRLFPMER